MRSVNKQFEAALFHFFGISILVISQFITPSFATSFDCRKASSYPEKTICADKELSVLDDALAKAYGQALPAKSSLAGEQRLWLKQRNACSDRDCLVSQYRGRLAELARQANEGERVCKQLAYKDLIEGRVGLNDESDEQQLGDLCDSSVKKCESSEPSFDIARFREMGLDVAQEPLSSLIKSSYAVSASMVDVNNDGIPDLRLRQVAGTASCQGNNFFIGTKDKTYQAATGQIFEDKLTELCGDDSVVFAQRGAVTYTVALGTPNSTVYLGRPDGTFIQHCIFGELPWTKEQERVAELIRKNYPDAFENAVLLRPTLEAIPFDNFKPFANKGDKVWKVVISCNIWNRANGLFMVHPKTHEIQVVISPYESSCN